MWSLIPTRVATLLERQGPAANNALPPQIAIPDPAIERLLRSMEDEVSQGCGGGSLYGQSLSLALTKYLEGRLSESNPKKTCDSQGKLSTLHVRRIVEYVEENLCRDFDLNELAGSISVSPRHFFRLFANTFGTTPHRYILSQRIGRAKSLLSEGLSVSHVAQELAFSSQSHFTSVFRKATGVPPGRFRDERL